MNSSSDSAKYLLSTRLSSSYTHQSREHLPDRQTSFHCEHQYGATVTDGGAAAAGTTAADHSTATTDDPAATRAAATSNGTPAIPRQPPPAAGTEIARTLFSRSAVSHGWTALHF